MRVIILAAAAAGLLAGCSQGEAPVNKVEEVAAALQPGDYEISATVDSIRSTDKSSPASQLKAGAPAATSRLCVGEDNVIDPQTFAEAGDTCTEGESYMRNGRMSLQFRCKRAGKGDVTHLVDGKFKKDSFEGEVITTTSFSGTGDYDARRTVTAKRTGDCSAKAG